MRIAYLKKHLGLTWLLKCGCKTSCHLHELFCCCCCCANSCREAVIETREATESPVLDFAILIQFFLESAISEWAKSPMAKSCVLCLWLSSVGSHRRVCISSMFLVATNVAVEALTENKYSKLPWRSYYRQMNKSCFCNTGDIKYMFLSCFWKKQDEWADVERTFSKLPCKDCLSISMLL